MTDRIHQSLFFPSEILHSRDLSSACNDASLPSNAEAGHRNIIICHKDRAAFYKSTRKVFRTADRIWSALSFSNTNNTTTGAGVVISHAGYFVGADSDSSSPGTSKSQQDANVAVCKRLSSEFGPCSSATNIDDMPDNVAVSKFSADGDSSGTSNCTNSKDGSQDDMGVNVIFFDLDSIMQVQEYTDSITMETVSVDLMQKVLSVLTQTVLNKGNANSIVHLRSETMYRIVASFDGTTSNNDSGNKTICVSGEQLTKYLLSVNKQSESEVASNTPIRRLRNTKGAANCPLTIYPPRFIEKLSSSSNGIDSKEVMQTVEICRFHNYDAERGCLRSKKARLNSEVKGCDMDHDHCHRCGERGHCAFDCPKADDEQSDIHLSSVVFRKTSDGDIVSVPFHGHNASTGSARGAASLPALLVLGGRLRGRTLATCEMLPLSSSPNDNDNKQHWIPLPNLYEHRGSHAGCSPIGSGLAFVLGGGTADGNSDAVEVLDFTTSTQQATQPSLENDLNRDWRWHMMAGKLSSPRHAFGAVSCSVTSENKDTMTSSASIFAVGGWKYGSVSCESMERLTLEYPSSKDASNKHELDSKWLHNHAKWELCAPLILPRRLHSVAASTDGSSIFVFGGYVDERRTTSSIERYDVNADKWFALEELLPYGQHNCPLVQAVADQNGFLIFPYSTEQSKEEGETPLVLRYAPGTPFSPVFLPHNNGQQLRLPIANWHSFSATLSTSLNRVFLVGGTVNGKWTNRSFELGLDAMEWRELPAMTFARRRLATLVLE